jgi:hemerythrin superfamily protein
MKAPSLQSAKKAAPSKAMDATTMLRADHKLVSGLFAEYEKTSSAAKKKKLVAEICKELSVHAQVEEEIFYPAVKRALKDKTLIPEAIVEQATMKALIAEVQGIDPHGEMYDAKIKVLSEYVKHHVKEEHSEMFPKAKSTSLDLFALGALLAARKAELMAAHE